MALLAIVEQFAATLKPALAAQRLQRVRDSGRDFDGEWGRDVLADHYRRAR